MKEVLLVVMMSVTLVTMIMMAMVVVVVNMILVSALTLHVVKKIKQKRIACIICDEDDAGAAADSTATVKVVISYMQGQVIVAQVTVILSLQQ